MVLYCRSVTLPRNFYHLLSELYYSNFYFYPIILTLANMTHMGDDTTLHP